MCIAPKSKNFELKSKSKSIRIPKRVELSSLDNNSCSFGNRNKTSCIKGYSKPTNYT